MGLSNGRTLGTIFTVGVASAALLVLITIAIILVSKGVVAAFDFYPDWVGRDSWAGPRLFAYGFGIPVAQGLEFNLGLMLNSMADESRCATRPSAHPVSMEIPSSNFPWAAIRTPFGRLRASRR